MNEPAKVPFPINVPIADQNLLPAKLRGFNSKGVFEFEGDPAVPASEALPPLEHAGCEFTLLISWQASEMTPALEAAYNSLGVVLDMTRMGMVDHHYVHGNVYALMLHAVELEPVMDAVKSEYAGLIGGHSNCVVRKGTEPSYNMTF